jgi:hypothetical protein
VPFHSEGRSEQNSRGTRNRQKAEELGRKAEASSESCQGEMGRKADQMIESGILFPLIGFKVRRKCGTLAVPSPDNVR